jgi:hypothetical protein
VLACRRRDEGSGLAEWFAPESVASLGPRARRWAQEEGWILGIG